MRSTVGTISVKAPQDAQVRLGDQKIDFGDTRIDSLVPGSYTVSAELPTPMDGCTEARKTAPVTVRAGAVTNVDLRPRLCGTLEILVNARRSNQNVAQTIWYSLQPEGGTASRETVLSPGPKVVTVGRYHLRVNVATCNPYDDDIEIFAGEPRNVSIVLLCPE